MKTCIKCNKLKNLHSFPKNKRSNSGYNLNCKKCVNLINKNYRELNKEKFKNLRKRYYLKNREKILKDKRIYQLKHRKDKANYDIIYRRLNKQRIKTIKAKWENLNKNNPIFKIKRNLRRRVNHALKGNLKKNKTFNLIGCTPEYFKEYISSLFTSNMSWDNYGEWHIDHIIPCFKFDLSNETEQRRCFHYTNQRPLWAEENLKRPRNI